MPRCCRKPPSAQRISNTPAQRSAAWSGSGSAPATLCSARRNSPPDFVGDAAAGGCESGSRSIANRHAREAEMALKIYGVARSRAFRILWMAKELGLDYEHVKIDFASGETRSPGFLALNPNGHVPVIDDDGFILWESMAINLYLAKKYGAGGLYPTGLHDEARVWQWSFWGMTEVERPVLTAMMNRAVYPADKRDTAVADEAEKALAQPLKVLDGVLGRGANLLGEGFTVADLNVA